jgi:pimeloyl-ACP methyl ester carboxylesterase
VWTITKRVALSLFGLSLALIVSGLAYRGYRQYQSDKALSIDSANGIDEAMFVRVGGIDQWITIRGQHRDNPVLLLLHGGPGVAMSPFALDTLSWESQFTIVQWDQRGAGKTYGKSGPLDPGTTIDRMVQDGVELTELLRRQLHEPKVTLVGVSWGTIVGVQMAKARPDLFDAYVGTGQVVNQRRGDPLSYTELLAEARARRDAAAIRELEAIGPPPYDALSELGVRTRWALAYEAGAPSRMGILADVLLAPRYTLRDCFNWIAGTENSQSHFFGETMTGPIMQLDLATVGTQFAIPMFVFQGAEDRITPTQLVIAYVDAITAPQKKLVLIEGAGHMAVMTRSDEFLRLLVQWVRPLTAREAARRGEPTRRASSQ